MREKMKFLQNICYHGIVVDLPPSELAACLHASRADPVAMDRILPLVYDRAREIALQVLDGDRAQLWVDASSLVQRAMIRLLDQEQVDLQDAARLSGVLAKIMRRIVVDIARQETADKRGGGMARVSLHALYGREPSDEDARVVSALEFEDALDALTKDNPEAALVAEMRLWGGMDLIATSAAIGQTYANTRTLWNYAKAWLARELAGGNA
ncbi:MAG: hypothetical protein JSR77_05640 [Planctomycetes bacterium]|nr:hypothetical protein [Planctomycetota bacterium]